MHTHKRTKLSRLWYNFKVDIWFWYKLFVRFWLEPEDAEEIMEDAMKNEERINKALGLPPLDAKNPYRFL